MKTETKKPSKTIVSQHKRMAMGEKITGKDKNQQVGPLPTLKLPKKK